MKDHVEISHLTKFHAFRVNRDQVVDLKTWFKIHTNFSKGRTIRKVMGGGGGEGNFQLARIFFFCPLLVQEFFFQAKHSARIFFFRQILLFCQ